MVVAIRKEMGVKREAIGVSAAGRGGPMGRGCVPRMAIIQRGWGNCGVVWKNREDECVEGFAGAPMDALLCRIWTPGLTIAEMRKEIMGRYPGCDELVGEAGSFHREVVPEWFHALVTYLRGYYTAALRGWTEPEFRSNWAFWKGRLDWSQVTEFQRKVLEVVATIPCGMSMTYGQVAARIGKAGASRAVGAAIGSNPWPVLVPCHRVVGAAGKLTGFSAPGGIDAKRRMLEMERG